MKVFYFIKCIVKRLLLLDKDDNLSTLFLLKKWNILFGRYLFHKKYNTQDIIHILEEQGIKKGSNIFIHCAWDSFYNYEDSIENLLNAIIEHIGPEGTIAMPAFPIHRKKIFHVKRTPTGAGLLAEMFRRMPNVKRSCNVRHSVCALGPLSEYLTRDHQKSLVCFDENSPYYRLCEKGFKVLLLGLPPYYIGTFQYVSQATMRHQIPYFSQFYDETKLEEESYIDYDGNEKKYVQIFEPSFFNRKSYYKGKHIIKKYFPKEKYNIKRISNLYITCIDANYANNKFIDLAKKNIFLYNYPLIKKSQRL